MLGLSRGTVVFGAVAFLAISTSISAQSYDPIKDFCRRAAHQAAVVDDKLYIDGGTLNLLGKGGRNYTNNRLLYHDLKTLNEFDMPTMYTNLSKPGNVPSVQGGTLWPDEANGKLYLYGGEYPEGTPADSFALWEYDTWYNNWTSIEADNSVHRASFGAGTTIEHLGKAFYLGGWQSERNVMDWEGPRRAMDTMLVYDMVQNQWRNQSGPKDGVARAEGVLSYIPAGDRGMLVYFGGVHVPGGNEKNSRPAPMNQVDIYDVASSQWYKQNTTGDTPELRRRFCAGVATAQDQSSYNIYLYGGMGFGDQIDGFDDVYILSIPSFKWIKAYPDNNRPDKDAFPHYDLSCTVINNAQMLIIGGTFPRDMEVEACDVPAIQGVHNLVMGKQNAEKGFWGMFQPNLTKYELPKDIIDVIGGEPTGAAKVKNPTGGFDHVDLNSLFTRSVKAQTREPTRRRPGEDGEDKKSNKGAIIGAAVGGGVALVLAICLLFFCYRRHNRKNKQVNTQIQQEDLRKNNSPAGLHIVTPTSEMSQPPLYQSNSGNHYQQGAYGPTGYHTGNPYQTSPPSSPGNVQTPSTPGGYTMSSFQGHQQFPGQFPPSNNMMHQQQYPYPGAPQTPTGHTGFYDHMAINHQRAEAPVIVPVELPNSTSPPQKIYPFIPPPQRDDGEPRQ
ncbi:hypothetical protein BJ508DRAFT_362404 [Ascobolus immersus RN42]|uniref:Galactose oxidase n=1 Tax=Ascobolus immersus RN42 TaxID=1160509 RepID=A0A3N4I3Q8_ASCIM|nr:hypothetical protein BJ508DRAFT_362404 [Ascobolus immersus RN42]